MKKFALIMVCSLIMVVLIVFNYLLWDRENKRHDIESLEYTNVSNNSSITALGEKINTLENENRGLRDRIDALEESLQTVQDENLQMEEDMRLKTDMLDEKRQIIYRLKQRINTSFLQEPIKEWAEALRRGDYESAYSLESPSILKENQNIDLDEYENSRRNSIKSISINSIEPVDEGVPDDKAGDFIFKVELNVEKVENSDVGQDGFEEGLNRRYITVGLELEKGTWVITHISPTI